MNTANVITSIAVSIAALSFVSGVSAWKREFIGKRQIELAESVLAMFYEVEDALSPTLMKADLENVLIMREQKNRNC